MEAVSICIPILESRCHKSPLFLPHGWWSQTEDRPMYVDMLSFPGTGLKSSCSIIFNKYLCGHSLQARHIFIVLTIYNLENKCSQLLVTRLRFWQANNLYKSHSCEEAKFEHKLSNFHCFYYFKRLGKQKANKHLLINPCKSISIKA